MFLEVDKEEMKKKILSAYCFQKPDSKFAQIVDKLGIEVAIKFVDEFFGEVLAIPTRNALKRAALPKIINDDLEGLKSESNQFKMKVKNWEQIWEEASADKRKSLVNLMTIKVITFYSKKQFKGKTYENKGLRIVFTPEIEELFEIGLLEADRKMMKENEKLGFFNGTKFRDECSDH